MHFHNATNTDYRSTIQVTKKSAFGCYCHKVNNKKRFDRLFASIIKLSNSKCTRNITVTLAFIWLQQTKAWRFLRNTTTISPRLIMMYTCLSQITDQNISCSFTCLAYQATSKSNVCCLTSESRLSVVLSVLPIFFMSDDNSIVYLTGGKQKRTTLTVINGGGFG